jgi:hypothetical protein
MRHLTPVSVLAAALAVSSPAIPCTVFTATDGQTTLAGNNEDIPPTSWWTS